MTRSLLPSGYRDFYYQTQIDAVGGIPPYTWSVADGDSLPYGLALNPVSGLLSGVPVVSVTNHLFRIVVTGLDGKASTNMFEISLLPPDFVPYSEPFNGPAFPPGWTISNTVPGSLVSWVLANGSSANVLDYPDRIPKMAHSTNLNATLRINSGNSSYANVWLISPPYDLAGTTNLAFSFWLCKAKAGKFSDELTVWCRASETNSWLKLATYKDSITQWTYQVFTNLPNASATFQVAFDGTVYGGWGVCVDDVEISGTRDMIPLEITTDATLPPGLQLDTYATTLAADGGRDPYTWSLVTSDALPDGLFLSEDGIISGTPTRYGEFTFGILVADEQNTRKYKTFTLVIVENPDAWTPYQTWKEEYFTQDIYTNFNFDSLYLLKYATAQDPTSGVDAVYLTFGITNLVGEGSVPDGRYFYAPYRSSDRATDVELRAVGKTNLLITTDPWTTNNIIPLGVPNSAGGGTWPWSWVNALYTVPVTNSSTFFIRLEVQLR
jgi:hypothetical protein